MVVISKQMDQKKSIEKNPFTCSGEIGGDEDEEESGDDDDTLELSFLTSERLGRILLRRLCTL